MNYLTLLLCNRKPMLSSRSGKDKAHKEGVVGKYVKKDTPPEIPVINVWSFDEQQQRQRAASISKQYYVGNSGTSNNKKSLQRCSSSSPSCEFTTRNSGMTGSLSRNTYSCNDSQPDYYHARRAQSQLPPSSRPPTGNNSMNNHSRPHHVGMYGGASVAQSSSMGRVQVGGYYFLM